ncbi:MAG: hypothetical protein QNJ46_11250, partial [Leptolyngbyaceae cyanobacterium MO_188.B28]|nr:hypothetical protein [Leptolyngbyaceae cyanobacterium MO_188.B28]
LNLSIIYLCPSSYWKGVLRPSVESYVKYLTNPITGWMGIGDVQQSYQVRLGLPIAYKKSKLSQANLENLVRSEQNALLSSKQNKLPKQLVAA